jgi:hypothetical protein
MDIIKTLGKIITSDEKRDAVHIAVAPVLAARKLYPGQRVGILPNGQATIRSDGVEEIGIVDPFLSGPVFEKQRFWLWLNPGTVTSVRHDWTHPAFMENEQ